MPQGSVLGPLFYILYANDIVNVLQNCEIALYADDTVLYTANTLFETSVRKIRADMEALSAWCGSNGIRMNVDKTKLMLFGNSKKLKELPEIHIKVEGIELKTVPSYKYLGVTLDSQLHYGKHLAKVISGASLKLKQLRRMRSFLDTRAATLVYKNMILPFLEYGDIFDSSSTVLNRNKLQILQNKALRCALNRDKYESVDELHADAKLLRLSYRRDLHLLSLMFDMSLEASNLKGPKGSGVSTRSSGRKLLKVRRPRTERFKKTPTYLGPEKWNALPEDIQQSKTKKEFKLKIQALVTGRSQKRRSID